jgi:acyl-CoA synthetase (NDP forming)
VASPAATQADDVARALVAAGCGAVPKPVLTCFVGAQGAPEALRGVCQIPSYAFPEGAARALGHAAAYAGCAARPARSPPSPTSTLKWPARS